MKIEGYVECVCGAQVLEHVAWLTEGVCWPCFRDGNLRHLREVQLMNRARRVTLTLPSRVKRGPKKTKTNKKKVEHAQRAAMRDMRALLPMVYDLFYADQRIARGLAPVPLRVPEGYLARVVETLGQVIAYSASDPGADADGQAPGAHRRTQ